MANKGSEVANAQSQAESDADEGDKEGSSSDWSSHSLSIFQLKPVTKSTRRKLGFAVLSPKVSHFTKQAVGSESLRQRMRTEHNERYFTVKRQYPKEEGEFLETENTENDIVGLEQETELHSSITVRHMEAFQAVFGQISCEHVFVIGRSEQNVNIDSLEEAIRGPNVSLLWFGSGNSVMRQESHFSC
ncbi:unnamed protein product [Linum trigynum]|uniref:Uncharacterized protein n=1 Tax=Linum trigynum TaxID=586398 RepID=A0AAV2FQP7_9ROSI